MLKIFIIEDYFRREGFEKAKNEGLSSLPYLPLSNAKSVLLEKGDVVVAHYSLAHSISPNSSPNIRYKLYFRVNVREDGVHHPQPMLHIWEDFPGLKEISEKMRGSVDLSEFKEGNGFKASYVDSMAKLELEEKMKKEQERVELLKRADELFKENKFKEAAEIYDRILEGEMESELIVVLIHACVAHTFHPPNDLLKGERYAKALCEKWPAHFVGWSLWGMVNALQGRVWSPPQQIDKCILREALRKFQLAFNCNPHEEISDGVRDALGTAVECVSKLGEEKEMEELVEKIFSSALEKYPKMRETILSKKSELNLKKLWAEAQVWIHKGGERSHKDFEEGRLLFEKIVSLKPQDFWATWFVGCIFCWDRSPKKGEAFLRKAMQIDSSLVHSFSALAQCLLWQGKHKEAVQVVREMLEGEKLFEGVEKEEDHKNKLFEAIKVAKEVLGKSDASFIQILNSARKKYPSTSLLLDSL